MNNEMISMVNIDHMHRVIDYFGNISVSKKVLKRMVEKWAANKEHIFKLFGGKLKISAPIEYTYNDSQIQNEVKKFIDTKKDKPYYALANILFKLLTPDEIKNNKINKDIYIFDKKFQEGTKIGRILNQIIPKKYAHEYITDYSMLIQTFKAKGEIVLSIDPLDYLTMSENRSGWESCHSLTGCYKTGCFAYMQDPSTIITYVKSSTPITIDDEIIVDNKVWRQIMLLSLDNKYAMQLRQYPNSNKNNSQTAANLIIKLLNEYNNTNNFVRKIYRVDEEPMLKNLIFEDEDVPTLWYNDLLHEAFKYCSVIAPENVNNLDDIFDYIDDYCEVGHDVECLCGCGEVLVDSNYLFYEDYLYYEEGEHSWDDED